MAFDIDAYQNTAGRVRDDDIDYAQFTHRPLSPDALRCLRYMSDIESHTVCYLRDLLVTPSHVDPAVTTFLTMWVFEEHWHGEVLAKVLAAHGISTGSAHISAVRRRLGWRDRMAPIGQALIANIVGEDFVAVHMTWGAINEWSAYAGYARLAELEQHPTLSELLTRIIRQEARHAAFYASQARDRLAASARARRLTRFALRRFWEPVGAGVALRSETAHMLRHLFSDTAGRRVIDQVDERVHRLPGLENLNLVRNASATY
ncbi:hypothetical protein Rhe02_05140 [Rhizocola hellebori]|uniref:Ferritin-like domain-containing protein n=1 Tax=Rhizocola hellebori TaxID=1392758 RepID=A0A8J3Q2W5_9ACTN|nr:hypothetical protein [Rhizocola hellebori]GIH02447.1 hypothetical protein Rhe02_05140 [Rhizocola hellebori]